MPHDSAKSAAHLPRGGRPSRRLVTRSVAWSVPVVTAAASAPARASSQEELFCGVNETPGMVGFEFLVTNSDPALTLEGVGACVTGGGMTWAIYPYLDAFNPPSVAPGATSVVRVFTYAPTGTVPPAGFTVDVVLHTVLGGVAGTITKSVPVDVPFPYQCVWFPESPLLSGAWSLRIAGSVSDEWTGEICP